MPQHGVTRMEIDSNISAIVYDQYRVVKFVFNLDFTTVDADMPASELAAELLGGKEYTVQLSVQHPGSDDEEAYLFVELTSSTPKRLLWRAIPSIIGAYYQNRIQDHFISNGIHIRPLPSAELRELVESGIE